MKTWFIQHPEYKAKIQWCSEDDAELSDVRLAVTYMLGHIPPTTISEGKPDNVVWP